VDLEAYFTAEGDAFRVTREQASQFAKSVAGDFNPIHDPDARRFCVPGDLLFSLLLNRIGLSRHISVEFTGMVDEKHTLQLEHTDTDSQLVEGDKTFLTASHDTRDSSLNVDGKKGAVTLAFNIVDGAGETVGHGEKHMLLSGLRAWEDDAVAGIIAEYESVKTAWQPA